MRIDQYIERLDAEGELLIRAAERAGPDATVPTCPGWRIRDLLQHIGGVHRWAASFVRDRRSDPTGVPEATFFTEPSDDDLAGWFRDGHAALLETLRTADPSVSCWSFLPAPSPLTFWARRQAHETTIHRVDAEHATGRLTEIPAEFAADGLGELLQGFLARRRGRLVADPPVSVGFRSTDTRHAWTMHVSPDGRRVEPVAEPADLVVSGPAACLYLTLWNRAGLDDLHADGDLAVWDLWRDRARITWN